MHHTRCAVPLASANSSFSKLAVCVELSLVLHRLYSKSRAAADAVMATPAAPVVACASNAAYCGDPPGLSISSRQHSPACCARLHSRQKSPLQVEHCTCEFPHLCQTMSKTVILLILIRTPLSLTPTPIPTPNSTLETPLFVCYSRRSCVISHVTLAAPARARLVSALATASQLKDGVARTAVRACAVVGRFRPRILLSMR